MDRKIRTLYLRIAGLFIAAGINNFIQAQEIKWTGGAYDGLWHSPGNWSGPVPLIASGADIVLDNSVIAHNYSVKITGSDSVVIRTLIIAPDSGKTITLWIDSTNITSLALTIQTIIIKAGGQLINASGALTGTVLSIEDSLYINNGALYSHQTRRAHTSIVGRLSRNSGTEEGIFEFNIPSASNTLSLSNQVYGTLRLSNERYGNNTTYSGGAANPLFIRGNLEIAAGVTLSLNFSDTIFIYKDYIQQGGVLNLANSTRNSVLAVKGDVEQSGGQVTKTGTGMPQWIFCGTAEQQVSLRGNISGQVGMVLDNMEGVRLKAPLLIPYRLELKRGKLVSSRENLLTIGAHAVLVADDGQASSFIDGPLKKMGLTIKETFRFPVGKSVRRWICLREASGNFSAEYFRGNPSDISSQLGPGLDHISSVEYWSVTADEASSMATIELSYSGMYSGGITDLQSLRVASVQGSGSWEDRGNTAVEGSIGADGSVQSESITEWQADRVFTLASSEAVQNPLPLRLLSFEVNSDGNFNLIQWTMADEEDPDYFAVEYSADGNTFTHEGMVEPARDCLSYQWRDPVSGHSTGYYRLKVVEKKGSSFYSPVEKIKGSSGSGVPGLMIIKSVTVTAGQPVCVVQSERPGRVCMELFDMNGRRYCELQCSLRKGYSTVLLGAHLLARGIYILRATDSEGRVRLARFIY